MGFASFSLKMSHGLSVFYDLESWKGSNTCFMGCLILDMQVFLARKSDGTFLAGGAGEERAWRCCGRGGGARRMEVVVIFCL